MFVVGLTGGIGSGKSTVAGLFRQKGIEIIDADSISREVVEPGQPALERIAKRFGASVLDHEGKLKRSRLRQLIFNDNKERVWLELLLHPLINNRIDQAIASSPPPYCILMSPLLLETEQKNRVDRILVVDVSQDTQMERTLRRDGGSQKTIAAIIASQVDRDKRLSLADDVINNEMAVDQLNQEVDLLHNKYLAISTGS